MIPFISLAALAISVGLMASGSPTTSQPAPLITFDGEKVPGSYIIQLKDNTIKANTLAFLGTQHAGTSEVKYGDWSSDMFHGFAAELQPDALVALRSHPDVESVYEDGMAELQGVVTQTNAPWGLSRISQDGKLTSQDDTQNNFKYRYDSRAGSGVDIYIIDTGINVDHVDFGGRARKGATFVDINEDKQGHGTHVAGTAGGTVSGVAKNASLISVQVFGAGRNGAYSNIISGVNYVFNQTSTSRRPSVACMSLGGPAYDPLDKAVRSLVGSGVHVSIAAGNDLVDAGNVSPARVKEAITVGASNIADGRWITNITGYVPVGSNYGSVVDIFAPGQNVISAWIGSTTAAQILNGTSMAAPHVAGLIAYTISVTGNKKPADMATYLTNAGIKNALTGIPAGTVNLLARNDIK